MEVARRGGAIDALLQGLNRQQQLILAIYAVGALLVLALAIIWFRDEDDSLPEVLGPALGTALSWHVLVVGAIGGVILSLILDRSIDRLERLIGISISPIGLFFGLIWLALLVHYIWTDAFIIPWRALGSLLFLALLLVSMRMRLDHSWPRI